MLIESDGLLFCGPDVYEPAEIWHYTRKAWVTYRRGTRDSAQPFGVEIGADRAEQLKVGNVDAEHYLYYDFPPWLQGTGP